MREDRIIGSALTLLTRMDSWFPKSSRIRKTPPHGDAARQLNPILKMVGPLGLEPRTKGL